MNVAEYILFPEKSSDSIALIMGEEEISYQKLIDQSYIVSHIALKSGFSPGDRVILISENSSFWAASYLGLLRIGIVCVPLSPRTSSYEFEKIIKFTEPSAVFFQSNLLGSEIESILPVAIPRFTEDNVTGEKNIVEITAYPADKEALAAIMFTSGSTGDPRGVMVSHRNIISNTESILSYMKLTSQDRIMVVLPFYYCFGTSLLHTHLRIGASLVLNNKFMFPDKVLKQMIAFHCTGFAGVPSTYQILIKQSSFLKMEFPDLRFVQQAGGKLSNILIEELQRTLPHTKIFIMYGQTEATSRLSYLSPELLEKKKGSVGKGIPGVKLSVLKNGSPVTPSEVGEIVAKGDNVTMGYWNDPAETAQTFDNGCLHTGDLATVDEEGFIYIVDRAKDFLKCGGYRVSSREIENMILRFPCIVEAAVIGIPDDLQGEAVKVFLVKTNFSQNIEKQFEEFCVKNFPPYLIPKETVFLNSLPKSSAGKVLKSKLKEFGLSAEKNQSLSSKIFED